MPMHWLFVCCSILATSILWAASLAPVASEISLNHQPLSISQQGRRSELVLSKEVETCPFASFLKKQFNDLSWGLMSQCPHQKAALFVTCLTECEGKVGGGGDIGRLIEHYSWTIHGRVVLQLKVVMLRWSHRQTLPWGHRSSIWKNMTWKTWSTGRRDGSNSNCCWGAWEQCKSWPDFDVQRIRCRGCGVLALCFETEAAGLQSMGYHRRDGWARSEANSSCYSLLHTTHHIGTGLWYGCSS